MAAKATPKNVPSELPILAFETAGDWSAWLRQQHGTSKGIWLKLAKKGSDVPSVTYPEAVLGALAWGWIDGQARPLDARFWLVRMTPRGAKSVWSKLNRGRATALIESGEMRPPGLKEVERAKADGRWDAAYDSPRQAQVPEDFAAALAKEARAGAFFQVLSAANRYAFLHRIQTAKKAETRSRRIAQYVKMLREGQTFHPQKKPAK